MSTLANMSYTDGDVVWVRLSNSWWPGEVVGESRLPEGLLASLKKQPIAVVRFFQESTFEYVYSIDKICLYNNQRKHTFIKKGLEAVRAKKKFMETFPEDVAIAEKMVNGDPDIINSDEFQPTKTKKETWSDIFIDPNKKQKTPKKDSPGQITTHRNSDHEVRILGHSTTPSTPVTPAGNSYKCRACPFSTNRMNVFILHNKTHTKEELATPKATPKQKGPAKVVVETPKTPRTLDKTLREPKKTPIIDDFVDDYLSASDTEEKTKKKRRGKKAVAAGKSKQEPQTPVKKSTRKGKREEKTEPEEVKTNTEIKNELLADWSDDEFGQEEQDEEKPEASDSRKSSEMFENLKKEEDEEKDVKMEATADVSATTSPIKCRNIPKKRDFVFDELKEEKLQEIKNKEEEKKQQQEEKKRLKEEEKQKREEEKQREIERIIKEKVEKQREKEEKRKEQEEKRKQMLEEKRKIKEEKKRQQELKKKEEEEQRQAELERQRAEEAQKKAEQEKRKQEEEQKRLEEEKRKIEAKKKMKGDFDLLMEQLEETPPPVRVSRRNKNKGSTTETPSKPAKIESPAADSNKPSRKSPRQSAPEPTKSDEPEIGEDEALAQEIKELLKETAVPDLVKDVEPDERKLPPKERGKRIFKEAQQVKSPKGVTSPSKVMTESELLIAETLTQLPQTAIQFSPKKSLSNKGHTSNDNDIAESLITLSTPPKSVSQPVPEPVTNSSSSPILNPRKRHLRALEEKVDVPEKQIVMEEKPEPKHEHLTKRQRMILEAQKAVETPPKPEARLPKKRKAEYQSEFESVVNKKLEEDRKVAAAHEKKVARTSARQAPDESLFDINNMEIVFDNAPTPSKTRPMSLSPIKVTKPQATPGKIICSPTKTKVVTRTEPQIIQLKQESRHVQRVSPIPQNAEIRRLSFPNTGTKEQKLRQEVTPTHRKVIKLITKPDGTKTLVEEVQPNMSRSSPTAASTSPLILRASSSSPLAKTQRSMTQSPILTTTRSSVNQKPQVIVGGASNKIIITSKGSLMTTTSPVTSTTARMPSGIRSSNKIQVQSEIIIPSSRVTSRIIEKSPVTTMRKEIIYTSQKKPIAPAPLTTFSSSTSSTSSSSSKSSKSNVLKLSPQQLKEAEELGYVEVRGNGKVLTKAGLKEFLPKINPNYKLKRKDSDSSGSLEATSSQGSRIERIKSADNSVICLDADDSPQKSPLVSQPKQKPIYKTINNDPIVIPDEEPEAPSNVVPLPKAQKSTSPLSVVKKLEEKVVVAPVATTQQETPVKPAPVVVESPTVSKSETPVVTPTPVTPTPTKENNNMGDQNSQILAVPAENFGGPANAFYLCSVGEDGTFTPMNNEALYLDASNQLVPMMPESQDKSEAGQEEVTNEESPDGTSDVGGQSIILNTGDGQQIILDQQSLLAMAVSGDVSQLFTQDGQQLILPGSAQEILNAIAASQNELGEQPILIQAPLGDQDILATALANTEVFQQDQLLTGALGDLNPPVKAHVSETNTVLTQSPIMSTSEQPTKNNGNVEKLVPELSKNLDEKLAEIGVTPQHQTNVPVSLELPITVTNPAIAPKTTTNPLELNSMYPATALGVAVSSTVSTQEISSALVGVLSTTPSTHMSEEPLETSEEPDLTPPITSILSSEISDEFIPDTPEASNHQTTQDTEDTNSSEIPLQPNIDPEVSDSNGTDLKNNGDLITEHVPTQMAEDTNGVNENSINNNSEEKQDYIAAPMDISDIPLPDDPPSSQQSATLETLNDQMEVDES